MTAKPKASEPDDAKAEATAAPEPKSEQAPACGVPHVLPVLAGHVTCQLAAGHKDAELTKPEDLTDVHEARDGDAHYTWT
jgi:hypothetical protein